MSHSLSHVSDADLLRDLVTLVGIDRKATATLLAHLAEVDARTLYRPAGYPSMFLYCVHELRLSRDVAYRRIHAARTARRYPEIFEAIADGRLHVSAVILLGPYLGAGGGPDLLIAAEGKTEFEIEQMLAERFPRTDVLALIEEVQLPSCQLMTLPGQSLTSGSRTEAAGGPIVEEPAHEEPAVIPAVAVSMVERSSPHHAQSQEGPIG